MVKSQMAHGSAPTLTMKAGLHLSLMTQPGWMPMKLGLTQQPLRPGPSELAYPKGPSTYGQKTGGEEILMYIVARWFMLNQVSLTSYI